MQRVEELERCNEQWDSQWHKGWDLYCNSWVLAGPFAIMSACSHFPVLLLEPVQSLVLLFSSYQMLYPVHYPLLTGSLTLQVFFCPEPVFAARSPLSLSTSSVFEAGRCWPLHLLAVSGEHRAPRQSFLYCFLTPKAVTNRLLGELCLAPTAQGWNRLSSTVTAKKSLEN